MAISAQIWRRLKLRHILFLLLLFSGIIPLVTSSFLLMQHYREVLETQEKTNLTRAAEALSREISGYLAGTRADLSRLGESLLAAPGPAPIEERLRAPWVAPYLQRFLAGDEQLMALRVLDLSGAGLRFGSGAAGDNLAAPLDAAFEAARQRGEAAYRFAALPASNQAIAAVAVPVVSTPGVEPALVLEAVVRLRILEAVFRRETRGEAAVFLVDGDGTLLWWEGAEPGLAQALRASDLLRDFARYPLNLTVEERLLVDDSRQRMLARVSPVVESGWGVVVLKPAAAAFGTVERLLYNTLVASALLVVVALIFAVVAARQVSRPIQRLAETIHEIAAGNFGRRVQVAGPAAEIADLAEDFNLMTAQLEGYVERLRRAAQANRDLFVSSIRALAAAIDAKDPYTRGHSERVAAMSRTVARHLSLPEEIQNRAWIGALLHDVGKIGIEDRILQKGGVLTAEEYETMKTHPVIGAEIMSPIEQLREMIPAIRWHHEAWNGRGYPDGLKGEQIPLLARIVAITDCFDAITTSRPYQRAYAPQFALETITKLTGSRFDAKVVTAFLRAFESGELEAAAAPHRQREGDTVRAVSAS
jgi:putative nucleotidyltransferase with HDIG domain